MKDYLNQLISKETNTLLKRSIVREYLQARVLQQLQEKGAFLNMAFLGGTSLRFLYSIPRYSEDLDFSKLASGNIEFDNLLNSIKSGFEAEDYVVLIKKSKEKAVLSAFIKFPYILYELGLSAHQDEVLSVKLEIDTNPPEGSSTEVTLTRKYILINLLHYDKASLFAGKIHAILARKYTKGRDLFDLIWILAGTDWPKPNFILLNNALKQTGWPGPEINAENWKEIIVSNIQNKNWRQAADDVAPFLEREGDSHILTMKNCQDLLNKFK